MDRTKEIQEYIFEDKIKFDTTNSDTNIFTLTTLHGGRRVCFKISDTCEFIVKDEFLKKFETANSADLSSGKEFTSDEKSKNLKDPCDKNSPQDSTKLKGNSGFPNSINTSLRNEPPNLKSIYGDFSQPKLSSKSIKPGDKLKGFYFVFVNEYIEAEISNSVIRIMFYNTVHDNYYFIEELSIFQGTLKFPALANIPRRDYDFISVTDDVRKILLKMIDDIKKDFDSQYKAFDGAIDRLIQDFLKKIESVDTYTKDEVDDILEKTFGKMEQILYDALNTKL